MTAARRAQLRADWAYWTAHLAIAEHDVRDIRRKLAEIEEMLAVGEGQGQREQANTGR